jgi:hypothetical protein
MAKVDDNRVSIACSERLIGPTGFGGHKVAKVGITNPAKACAKEVIPFRVSTYIMNSRMVAMQINREPEGQGPFTGKSETLQVHKNQTEVF